MQEAKFKWRTSSFMAVGALEPGVKVLLVHSGGLNSRDQDASNTHDVYAEHLDFTPVL